MTGNQTMDYNVRPRHLYSHSRTCTCSGLWRRLSRLVAFLICYLLNCASVHEISALVTWFQCMSDIFSHHGDNDPLYIFIMEILIYLYCMWRLPNMSYFVSCLFMAIVLLYIWDCCSTCSHVQSLVIALYCWMASYSSLHFWDGLIMYFGHRITPLTSHIRGHLLYLMSSLQENHTLYGLPLSCCRLLRPRGPFFVL